jgi:hypothetical protein
MKNARGNYFSAHKTQVMTTKTWLSILLLAPFFGLSAQDVVFDFEAQRGLVFETVSFANKGCGDITIVCASPEKVTQFEIKGTDAHLNFEWSANEPSERFPMKLCIKPGKVKIRYKIQGQRGKTIRFHLVKDAKMNVELK